MTGAGISVASEDEKSATLVTSEPWRHAEFVLRVGQSGGVDRARLCAEAKDGQILLSQRVNVALKGSIATEQLGPLALKGLTQPVVAYNVPRAAIQPALRVIEGGPQSI